MQDCKCYSLYLFKIITLRGMHTLFYYVIDNFSKGLIAADMYMLPYNDLEVCALYLTGKYKVLLTPPVQPDVPLL